MLQAIHEKLMALGLVDKNWVTDADTQGRKVALYRELYNGDHQMKLTDAMRNMLNISSDVLDQFNLNYCQMVVTAMADRLTVDSIKSQVETQDTAAQEWIDGLMYDNRFDALQIDVREAALRDGLTFVMVSLQEGQPVRLTHEMAWDTDAGIIEILDASGTQLVAAVNIWWEGDVRRCTLYFPDHIEKYRMDDSGGLTAVTEPTPVRTLTGDAAGIPLVMFARKKTAMSELNDVRPLQQALNRALVDMVMSSLLTGFSFMWAKGWAPKQNLTPGTILVAQLTNPDGSTVVPQTEDQGKALQAIMSAIDLQRIEPGDLSQIINHAKFLIDQIGFVSATPLPGSNNGGSEDGDTLRQRDERLLGKITSAQVRFGNAWEDVVTMAARLETGLTGRTVPELRRINTKWKTGEIRNNADILAAANWLITNGFEREALRVLSQSTLADFSEKDIDKMLADKASDSARATAAATGNLPDFGEFNMQTAV